MDTITDNPVEIASRAAGSQYDLARLLGITRQAVTRWKKSRIPAERVLEIERATGVSRHVLRPDIYPREGRRR